MLRREIGILPLSLFVNIIFFVTVSIVQGDLYTIECQNTECHLDDPFLFVDNGDKRAISFAEANEQCRERYGTHLAVIDSLEKLYAANSTCIDEAKDKTGDTAHCWIGLRYNRDADTGTFDESNFEWVDGTTETDVDLNRIGFGYNEPGGYIWYEDCVEIRGDGASNVMNKWNDVNCSGETSIYNVSMYLCDNPDYGEDGCVCDCGCCMIVGDPHITGFDQLLWHFMGLCSYYYVTTCDGNKTLEGGIPFEITGEHYECYPQIEGRTCMNNTYVRFYTSQNPPQLAAIVRLGEGYSGNFCFVCIFFFFFNLKCYPYPVNPFGLFVLLIFCKKLEMILNT